MKYAKSKNNCGVQLKENFDHFKKIKIFICISKFCLRSSSVVRNPKQYPAVDYISGHISL